ncbi:hypothetical protein KU6B_27190 [Mameliella alba]|uniref:hypothetical protein n=1 Tax=Mameliella alba TaxID=561184 RepID=UPI0013E4EA20|nr:hypothetical protein [Mameliella alba]BBU56454.1 hypothetical protein KU6B_27190 [Mameliella alba]
MPNITPARSAGVIALRSIWSFVAEHFAGLSEASLLLGGQAAQRRFLRLVSRLRQASGLGPHLRREIRWLHGVLTLELIGDPDATDPGHFCDIHPDDLVVTGICRLVDAMTEVLCSLPVASAPAATPLAAKGARVAA